MMWVEPKCQTSHPRWRRFTFIFILIFIKKTGISLFDFLQVTESFVKFLQATELNCEFIVHIIVLEIQKKSEISFIDFWKFS